MAERTKPIPRENTAFDARLKARAKVVAAVTNRTLAEVIEAAARAEIERQYKAITRRELHALGGEA